MAFEAYKVAVRLSLVETVSAGLLGLSRHFMAANKNAQELQRSIGQIQKLMMAGGAMVGVGVFGLKALQAPLDEAKRFQTELAKFSLYGLGEKTNNEAAQFAKAMNVMGSSATENMKLMTEAQGVFRESGLGGSAALEGAKLAAPVLAKIAFATSSMDEDSKAKYRTSSMDMLRFIEMRGGLKSPTDFNRIADEGWKAMRSSGGNVDWSQYRQFMARGGVAAQGLSDEALFGKLEPVIGEMKGSTAGFSLRTAYNRLNGIIRLPNQVAHELANSGVWDNKQIDWNSQGGIKSFKGNPLVNQAQFASDPVEFYEKTIKPMYAKLGIASQAQISRENAMIFGSTGGAMFSLIDRQLPNIHASVEAQRKTLGIDASVKAAGGTLDGKEVDLHAKWANLMLQLGDSVLPLAIRGITALISAIKGITQFAKDNPGLTKFLVQGLAIFSVLSIAAGGILLFRGALLAMSVALRFTAPLYSLGFVFGRVLSIAISGFSMLAPALMWVGRALLMNPIGLTLTAIAGAAYLIYRNWSVVGPKLSATWAKMKSDFGDVVAWFSQKWQVMSAACSGMQGALGGLVSWINSAIGRITKLLPNWMVPERDAKPKTQGPLGGNPAFATKGGNDGLVHTAIYIDGKKVAQAVTPYIAQQTGLSTSTGGVDAGVSLPMPGLKY
jgi:hypothetical protein